jgi:hypothetical protein
MYSTGTQGGDPSPGQHGSKAPNDVPTDSWVKEPTGNHTLVASKHLGTASNRLRNPRVCSTRDKYLAAPNMASGNSPETAHTASSLNRRLDNLIAFRFYEGHKDAGIGTTVQCVGVLSGH